MSSAPARWSDPCTITLDSMSRRFFRSTCFAEEIADSFERSFVSKMEALKVGDLFDPKTELGPLATADGAVALDEAV